MDTISRPCKAKCDGSARKAPCEVAAEPTGNPSELQLGLCHADAAPEKKENV